MSTARSEVDELVDRLVAEWEGAFRERVPELIETEACQLAIEAACVVAESQAEFDRLVEGVSARLLRKVSLEWGDEGGGS